MAQQHAAVMTLDRFAALTRACEAWRDANKDALAACGPNDRLSNDFRLEMINIEAALAVLNRRFPQQAVQYGAEINHKLGNVHDMSKCRLCEEEKR